MSPVVTLDKMASLPLALPFLIRHQPNKSKFFN